MNGIMRTKSNRLKLDETDLKIVHMLSHDGRMSRSVLAENVGGSRPARGVCLSKDIG